MRRGEIIQAVKKIDRLYETRDPFRVCRYMGIQIRYQPFEVLNGLLLIENRIPIICINEQLDERKMTIVCAHELGHYALAHYENKVFLATHTYMRLDKFEIAANTFVAELLISDDDYEEYRIMGCSEEQIGYSTGLPVELVRLKR